MSSTTIVSKGTNKVTNSLFAKSAKEHLSLCFVALLFLLQTVPYLSYRWVTDESWYAGPGYSIAHGNGVRDPAIGPNDIENHFDARPPGTALVIASTFKALGEGPAIARLGSIFAGLLSIGLIYSLTRDLLGPTAALLATLLFATDNLVVLAARTARPEALTVAAILLALVALNQYSKSLTLPLAALTGLLFALATMFHVTVLGYIVASGILIILLDRKDQRFSLRGAAAYTVGFFAGLIPFATWIITSPLGPRGFRAEFLGRANTSLLAKLLGEGHRYSDILGFSMLHGHGLESLPVRLPIPLCFVAASFLLWKFRRSWFYVELFLLIPSILWLAYTVNKSSRYIAILAPIFAVTIAAAVSAVREHRILHRIALVLACIVIVAQAGANFVLLRAASKANYQQVGAQLRALIPSTEPAYASITFWLAFHDRPFISYERTTPWMAAQQYGVHYFVLGDRTMVNGLPGGGQPGDGDFYRQLNRDLAEVTARSIVIGHVVDPYYGDLSVYKLVR